MKKLIVGFVFLLGLLFLLSIIFQSKFLLQSDEEQFSSYWQKKEIHLAGKIIDFDKASARNKAFVIKPSYFHVQGNTESTAIGFVNADTSICIVVAPYPKLTIDSLALQGSTAHFYNQNKHVATEQVQILRWNTMQRILVKQKEAYGELTAF